VVGSISGLSRLRQFERIAKDNEKIVHHMSAIGAYYSNSDMAEDRQKQLDRMERFKKFRTKKGANAKIAKAGLKGIYKSVQARRAASAQEKRASERAVHERSERNQAAVSVPSVSSPHPPCTILKPPRPPRFCTCPDAPLVDPPPR
jgi:hypothetical protein